MKEIIIKVPDEIDEKQFAEYALIFVENKLREKVRVIEAVEQKFKDDVDNIRVENKLPIKYNVKG